MKPKLYFTQYICLWINILLRYSKKKKLIKIMIHALNFKFKNIPIVFFAKLFYLAEIVGHSPKRLSCKIVLLTTKEKETVHKNFTS